MLSLSLPLYQQLSGRRPTRRSRPASPPLLRHKIEKRKRKNRKYVRAASSLWEVIKRQPKIKKRKKKSIKLQKLIHRFVFSYRRRPSRAFWILNLLITKIIIKTWDATGNLKGDWETFFTSTTSGLSLNKTKSPPSSLAFAARPFERRWRCERRVPESKAKRSFTHTEREKGFKNCFS